eukprot:6204792-Pleurochrysis_carterae.AAC.4
MQMYRLLCDAHADEWLVLARTGLTAVNIVLAPLYYSQRGGAKGAVGARAGGLVVLLRNLINQRRIEDDPKGLSAAETEDRLLIRWDTLGQPLAVLPTLSAKTSARAACAIPQAEINPLMLEAAQQQRVNPVGNAADGTPIMPGIPRAAAHGEADADADADVAAPAASAAPAPLSAGRHRFSHLSNLTACLEAEIDNLDKGPCARCVSEILSNKRLQHSRRVATAEEARGACETKIKQQQATANVKYKALLKQMQEERDAPSDKATGLEENITELLRPIRLSGVKA